MSWKDAVLHIPLGLALTGIAAATMALPWPLSAFVIGSEMIFLREVSQKQEDIDSETCKICTGWDFWNWGASKLIETWVPIAVLLILGVLANEWF